VSPSRGSSHFGAPAYYEGQVGVALIELFR